MPVNITDVDAFTDPVTAPDDGDAASGANFQSPIQKLSNRSRRLKNRLDFLTAQTSAYLTEFIGAEWFAGTVSDPHYTFGCDTDSSMILFPIRLRKGDILTAISGLVFQGNAGASGQMSMQLWRQTNNASSAPTVVQVGSTVTFTAGAGHQTGSIAVASNGTVDLTTYVHFVKIMSSALAATNRDIVRWVKATYTPVGT